MNTKAERNGPVRFPIDEEFVGLLKYFRVMVRCGEGNEQLVAFVYRAPLDDRVVKRRAVEPGKIGWIRPEMPEARADGARCRVDASEDQKEQIAELQLSIDRFSIDLSSSDRRVRSSCGSASRASSSLRKSARMSALTSSRTRLSRGANWKSR